MLNFFDTAEQARASGLRPCKRCRPDLLEFHPQKENAEKIKVVYDLYFSDHDRLKEELKKAWAKQKQNPPGVSESI